MSAITPGPPIPDRTCAQCAAGHTNLCLTYDEIGFTRAGAAVDQLLLPAQVVPPLAAQPGAGSARLADAALAEHAAVAWRGITLGQPRPGKGADRGGRRRHRRPHHRAPAPAVLPGRPGGGRSAPGAGRSRGRARRDRVRAHRPRPGSRRGRQGRPRRPVRPGHRPRRASPPRSSTRSGWPAGAAASSSSAWQATGSPPPSRSTTWSTTTSRSPPASATPRPPGPTSPACSGRARSSSPRPGNRAQRDLTVWAAGAADLLRSRASGWKHPINRSDADNRSHRRVSIWQS